MTAAVAHADEPSAVRRVAARSRGELLAWALLIAAAIAVRLIALGDRPFHHDESQDAYFSYLFRTTGDYAYNPLLHGPLRFYLTAGAYVLFGDSDFTARLAPALMGALMVPMPYGLRRQLGRGGAFAAGALLAFGPTYLYFSRFAREDIYVASITLALIVVTFRFLERPRRHQPALIGALLALSFATKETTFITVFVAGTFFLAALAYQRRRARSWREVELVRTVAAVGWAPWAWAAAAFVAVFTILFTTFLTHPHGLWDGVYTGLKYWLSQHSVGRGGESDFFYVVVLLGEEWPVLLLGAFGAVAAFRRPTLLRLFLVWDFVLSLIVYSWAGEKFAWLVMHPLLPLILLAGLGVQAIWSARHSWAGRAGIALAVLGFAYAGIASFWVNAVHRADPRELLVSTQSSEQVKQISEAVVARAGSQTPVTVDSADGASFPYAWYFRHLDAGYPDLSASGTLPAGGIAILTDASRERLRGQLSGYEERPFDFRVWWVRDYSKLNPGSAWRWLSARDPWSPTGGMREWLEWPRSLGPAPRP
ncbi:MAG TPA: flippase activity-associated protein Agl23 [Solirubrobacteraceae bacterium]|nr:flippase activity-associated protein Agl23 [Solirubrobacteraceae bacterium]